MNSSDFKKEADEFLFDFISSPVYLDYLKKKKEVENDSYLSSLSIKRSEAYLKSTESDDEKLKKEYLLEFSKLTEEIYQSDKYKDYNEAYLKVKRILNILNEGILDKIR